MECATIAYSVFTEYNHWTVNVPQAKRGPKAEHYSLHRRMMDNGIG